MTTDRPFPRDEEAERALLGGCMQNAALCVGECVSMGMEGQHFYRPEHGALFELLVRMTLERVPVDMVTVPMEVQRTGKPEQYGGVPYVIQLPDHCPSTANVAHYAKIVIDKFDRREIITTLERRTAQAWSGTSDPRKLGDQVINDVLDAAARSGRTGWTMVGAVVDAEAQAAEYTSVHPEAIKPGMRTGLNFLDDKLGGGFFDEDLLVLAARPAMGKTALALNIADNMAMAGNRVGIFSMEMTRAQLVRRMLCSRAHVDSSAIRQGILTAEEIVRLNQAAEAMRPLQVHIDDSPALTIRQVHAKARRLVQMLGGLELIVIDYLQLMEGPQRSREEVVSACSRGSKQLGKDLGCPVLLISQLNRKCEERKDKRPMVSDLRESGAIEQDADQIMLLFRGEHYWPDDTKLRGLAEVNVAKSRHGPIGVADLAFDGPSTRFDDPPIHRIAGRQR